MCPFSILNSYHRWPTCAPSAIQLAILLKGRMLDQSIISSFEALKTCAPLAYTRSSWIQTHISEKDQISLDNRTIDHFDLCRYLFFCKIYIQLQFLCIIYIYSNAMKAMIVMKEARLSFGYSPSETNSIFLTFIIVNQLII